MPGSSQYIDLLKKVLTDSHRIDAEDYRSIRNYKPNWKLKSGASWILLLSIHIKELVLIKQARDHVQVFKEIMTA